MGYACYVVNYVLNVRYNDENENNVPCDLASYIPIRSNKSEK